MCLRLRFREACCPQIKLVYFNIIVLRIITTITMTCICQRKIAINVFYFVVVVVVVGFNKSFICNCVGICPNSRIKFWVLVVYILDQFI